MKNTNYTISIKKRGKIGKHIITMKHISDT